MFSFRFSSACEGHGPVTLSMTPARTPDEIRTGVQEALSGSKEDCLPEVPGRLKLDLSYPNPTAAYRDSWYPRGCLTGPCDVRFETDDCFEVLRA